jgi:FkbM family methyltransferase
MAAKRGFDWLEVALISVAMVGLGYFIGARTAPVYARNMKMLEALTAESRALEKAYGPHSNSEYQEEWVLRDFFLGKRDGLFVDVGANHYQQNSNTYYLETALGWSGIAVEPLREFEAGYTEHRPRTRFRAFFATDVSNEQAKMYVLKDNELVSSADRNFTARFGSGAQEISVPTVKLDDLLAAENIGHIDFLSIDVELHEPQVLAGLDVQRFRPALVSIEAHPEVRQRILDYFARRDYVVIGKYLRADTHNLYFRPLADPADRRE